jgi:hypothetical protein
MVHEVDREVTQDEFPDCAAAERRKSCAGNNAIRVELLFESFVRPEDSERKNPYKVQDINMHRPTTLPARANPPGIRSSRGAGPAARR